MSEIAVELLGLPAVGIAFVWFVTKFTLSRGGKAYRKAHPEKFLF